MNGVAHFKRGKFGLRFSLCALGVCLALSGAVAPALRGDEFSQVSHHSARLLSRGTLAIDSRVGDIYIEGWDEPRVEIEAEKVVRAASEAKAKRLYGRIHIQLEGRDTLVRLSSLYPPRRLWRPFRGESKLTVNYRIKMPSDSNLTLQCVDGDVTISGITGREELKVNYGDVEIDVPHIYQLRLLDAHTWLGYVQSDLSSMEEDSSGFRQRISYFNSGGDQDITVHVRMGGVFIYRTGD